MSQEEDLMKVAGLPTINEIRQRLGVRVRCEQLAPWYESVQQLAQHLIRGDYHGDVREQAGRLDTSVERLRYSPVSSARIEDVKEEVMVLRALRAVEEGRHQRHMTKFDELEALGEP